MAIRREHRVPLASLSTFRIGGTAREVVLAETEDDLKELFLNMPEETRWFMLGGGSNIVFPDGDADVTFIRLGVRHMDIVKDGEDSVLLAVGGGAIWDDVVAFAVAQGLSGIEALSAIPGSAGATPVQNVGAYGTEISDVLVAVRAFDTQTKKYVTFANAECAFAYRDSMFKHAGKGRYIITELLLQLSRELPDVPQYPGVAEYFAQKGISRPTLADIREAITTIRWKKLPDPREVASVGSFFKNPFVTAEHAEKLRAEFPDMKMFPSDDGKVKIPAGWLIEQTGWKGRALGPIATYQHNALVLVNTGGAGRADVLAMIAAITGEVSKKFDILLEPEPELLNF